ncbi:hypothetical protein [Sphingopyxis sp. 113P3]|uniref:hypothetical protein n=1 Tax=Sphingopyxis sp. (strain 113P3) TaxID=292913 RepID=UPI0006AD5B88|nr:hypothetical protein [Sphingopyxis sp. 113P3]ALC13997.1 hypothetical protein LH20_18725 [Sphingopyxis sp. 113P3]
MMRWMMPASLLMLAACSGGQDEKQPAQTAEGSAPAPAAEPAEPPPAAAGADIAYTPDPSVAPPAAPDPGIGSGEKAIPAAIQGRWALKGADCTAPRGSDLTALVIDGKTLRFFESAGELARVRDRSANRIIADYKFSGEGEEWDRLMLLAVEDGGKLLFRRDYGEGAAAEPMRYTRCAA